MVLKLNPTHFHIEKSMAQEVRLIPTRDNNKEEVIELFNQGKVDHLTTIEGIGIEHLKKIDLSKSSFHETIHVKIVMANITEKGKRQISVKKRLAFAKALQKSFHEYCQTQEGCRPTRQFFLPLSGGEFSTEEEIIFQKTMDSVEMENSGKGIELGVFSSSEKRLQEDTKVSKTYLPDLKVKRVYGLPAFDKFEDSELPDYTLSVTDTGFLEDVSLLSYSVNAEILDFQEKKARPG